MTLVEFVAQVKAGEVKTEAGGRSATGVATWLDRVPQEAEAIAAEAFNQGVLDSEGITWDAAVASVERLLSGHEPAA